MSTINYREVAELRCRGAVSQEEPEAPKGLLLVGDVVALEFSGPASSLGSDGCTLKPAVYEGKRAWMLTRRWYPGHGYSASGTEDVVLDFEAGVKILCEHGVFAFPT
jgi:hypothetical protein